MAPGAVTAPASAPLDRPPAWRRPATIAAGVLIALLGAVAVHMVIADVRPDDVAAALGAVPPASIAASLALTVLSYALLTFYDSVALATIGRPQPWRVAASGALIGQALGYNLGLPLLTANVARFRIYGRVGVSMGEVVQVGAIVSIAFWSGVAALTGVALLVAPPALPLVDTGAVGTRVLGGLLLLGAATAPLIGRGGGRRIGWGRVRLPLPGGRGSAVLAAVSMGELLAAAGALFVLLPTSAASAFPAFFLAYALAIVVATVSHVPGGIGVFEAVVLAAHEGAQGATHGATLGAVHSGVLAALILFRVIYYLGPLAIALGAVALREAQGVRQALAPLTWFVARAARVVAPPAATVLVFASGVVLLASGALPAVDARLMRLDGLLPLPLIEGSHLANSLVGTALLLVTPALSARLRSGWLLARPLLLAGALFSLLKGIDYEEASLQLVVLAILHYARPSFYRRGGVASEPLDARWLVAAAAALALSVGAGLLAYRPIPYSDDLWWQFALEGDAPRFLRATFAAAALLSAAALWQLFLGRASREAASTLPALVAERALAAAPRTDANLAFTGDKRFISSASGDAFIMYGVRGRTWIAMGDPVGPAAAWEELVWSLRRACDAAAARLCFYQVSGAMLPILVDLGMNVMKYGEEAHVALAEFSLAGPDAKNFRHALRRATDAGLAFAVVPSGEVDAIMAELRAVSDAWLGSERGREKGFSLGVFDPAYLRRFPIAVVRREGRAIAFANIWTAPISGELSVDLMRHVPDQPAGTMDMMFVRLFEWGREHGYSHFNLGVAPLSGMPRDYLAPAWAKIGRLVFERGGRLYSFRGLRAFKAKFRPTWHARYIGQPRGLRAIPALLGLVAIVNRSGVRSAPSDDGTVPAIPAT